MQKDLRKGTYMKKLIFTLLLFMCLALNGFAGGFDESILHQGYSSWGVESESVGSINLRLAWKNFTSKKVITIAVVDTGIDSSHSFIKGSVIREVDFSHNLEVVGSAPDEHGHGTHVSGTIKSVYPDVQIMALKYYNPKASGMESLKATLAALKYAVDQNVDIINYSGGGPEASTEEYSILREAERKGILVVCAAGNEGSDIDQGKTAFYPASYSLDNVLSVSGYDQEVKTVNSSNFGIKNVDIAAPGYRIRGPLPNGRSGYLTGTSQATAFVTGVAALIKSNYPELTMAQLKSAILLGAKKETNFKSINGTSARLDAYFALIKAREITSQNQRNLAFKK